MQEAILKFLGKEKKIQIVGAVSTGETAIKMARKVGAVALINKENIVKELLTDIEKNGKE